MKAYLEAGEFVTTHGIEGELRLYPYADDPAFLADFSTLYLDENGRKAMKALSIRPHKNICIVRLEDIHSVEEARPLIGKTAYIARSEAHLPKGRYFVQDLLGAQVVDDATSEVYGTITGITHPGRHDIYEVTRPWGGVALFPAADVFLAGTDIEKGEVRVNPIEGMFPPEEEEA